MRWLDGIMNSLDTNLSKLQESGGQKSLTCCFPRGHERWTGLSNLTFSGIKIGKSCEGQKEKKLSLGLMLMEGFQMNLSERTA